MKYRWVGEIFEVMWSCNIFWLW